ncbi:MAG: GNAT family N-acetyltransferase [Armatimonadota bacterium]|nr:GNAT family N-acetyltransferase [Armatimonadota bacterium]
MPEDPQQCFRLVRPDEVESIAQLAVRAWKPIYENMRRLLGEELFRALHPKWEENKAEQVRSMARRHPEWVYVTEVEGRVVGFITFTMNSETGVGEIGNNAVDPEYQGGGVGTAQHREVLRIFREHGMRVAKVTTGLDEAHAPARRSYEKAGFNRCTTHITYFLYLGDW